MKPAAQGWVSKPVAPELPVEVETPPEKVPSEEMDRSVGKDRPVVNDMKEALEEPVDEPPKQEDTADGRNGKDSAVSS